MYHCTSKTQLSDREMGYIARSLKCTISETGPTEDGSWNYFIRLSAIATKQELEVIKEKGLVLLLTPEQTGGFRKLASSIDISRYEANLIHLGLKPAPKP